MPVLECVGTAIDHTSGKCSLKAEVLHRMIKSIDEYASGESTRPNRGPRGPRLRGIT